ncbi:MAG: hypothetical protein RMX65_030660 [Nostoc sp. DedQUE01]
MVLVTNLLRNGDFSEGNVGWIIEHESDANGSMTLAEIITDPDPKRCYLKLTNSNGEKQYVVQQTVAVKPNKRYDLVAKTFYLEGAGKIWRKRQKPSESRSDNTTATEQISLNQAKEIDEIEIDGNWRMHFFTEADTSELTISFTCVSDSPSQECISGISEVFLYEHNLVQNGDFSQYMASWEPHLPSSNSTARAINGELQITLNGKASQKITDIQPNTEYRLTFRNQNPWSGEGNIEIAPDLISEKYTNGAWENKMIEFTTTDDTSEIEIILWSPSTALFDDFALSAIKRPAQY